MVTYENAIEISELRKNTAALRWITSVLMYRKAQLWDLSVRTAQEKQQPSEAS